MGMTEMLRLVITADADQAVKKIKQLGGVSDDAAKSTDGLGESSKKTGLLMKAGLVAGATAAAYGLARFATASVKAASEAEESQKKLEYAFAKFPKLADTNITALRELNTEWQKKSRFDDDAIASGQAVLAQFDITGRQLKETTPLLLDYAAAQNITVAEAANNVGKALLGNAKALKNLGIFYKSTGDATTDYANITELMRQKVGGFAEQEGKTAAGQLAILNNQFGELQETVGKNLLPALSGLVTGTTAVVSAFGSLPPPVQTATLATVALGTATLVLVPRLAAAKSGLVELGLTSSSTAGKLAAAGVTAVKAAAGFGVLAFGVSQLNSPEAATGVNATAAAFERLARGTKGADFGVFGEDLKDFGDKLNQYILDPSVKQRMDDFAGELLTLGSSEGSFGRDETIQQLKAMDAALAGLAAGGNTEGAADRFDALAASAKEAGIPVEKLRELFPQYADALAGVGGSLTGAAGATGDLASATGDLNGELDGTIEKFTLLNGGAIDLTKANMDFVAGQEDITSAFTESKGAMGDLTAEQRAAKSALLDQASAAQSVVDAMLATGSSQAEAAARAGEMRQAMIDQAVAAGGNREEITKLIDEVLRIPSKAEVSIVSDTRPAQKILDEWIEAQKGRRIAIPIIATGAKGTTGGITMDARAAGGPVTAGTPYLVGEKGPELFVPGASGGIVPNGALSTPRAASRPGSTMSVTVNVGGSVVSERDLVRAVRDGLVDMQRRGDTVAA